MVTTSHFQKCSQLIENSATSLFSYLRGKEKFSASNTKIKIASVAFIQPWLRTSLKLWRSRWHVVAKIRVCSTDQRKTVAVRNSLLPLNGNHSRLMAEIFLVSGYCDSARIVGWLNVALSGVIIYSVITNMCMEDLGWWRGLRSLQFLRFLTTALLGNIHMCNRYRGCLVIFF